MWPYWLLFLWPALAVAIPQRVSRRDQWVFWWLTGLLFSVAIGLRYEVGGDWINYASHMRFVASAELTDVLNLGDPGYYVTSWIVAQLGGGILIVNLICAVIVMAGVITFARAQPQPWLALLVAVPYLIIVVAMGYTRQSAALGFAMIGLVALGHQRLKTFVFWVLVGALFHKSAVLLLPVAALAASRNRLWNMFWIGVVGGLGVWLLVGSDSDTLWTNYVVADYQSEGGLIRVVMNAVPSVLVLLFRRRLIPDEGERRLWIWMALLALACLPLVVISSTAVDRVALYFIPIQMYVFARLHRIATTQRLRTSIVLGVIAYCAAVEFVWLNFAKTAFAWVPYHFMPL